MKVKKVHKFIAFDQYGNRHLIKGTTPRKALMEFHGVNYARPIFADRANGKSEKVGWNIGDCWYDVYRLEKVV